MAVEITNGSDDRFRDELGRSVSDFIAANAGKMDMPTVCAIINTLLMDAAWTATRSVYGEARPGTPELFGEAMRQLGELVAHGRHIEPPKVLQ